MFFGGKLQMYMNFQEGHRKWTNKFIEDIRNPRKKKQRGKSQETYLEDGMCKKFLMGLP